MLLRTPRHIEKALLREDPLPIFLRSYKFSSYFIKFVTYCQTWAIFSKWRNLIFSITVKLENFKEYLRKLGIILEKCSKKKGEFWGRYFKEIVRTF